MVFGGAIKLNKRGYALIGLLVVIFLYFHFHNKSLQDNESQVNLSNLLQVAIQAAEEGGKLVVSTKEDLKVQSKGKTKEGMDDRVTTADFLSHCAMKHIITKAFSTITFISEEKGTPCEDYKTDDKQVKNVAVNIPEIFVKAKDVTVWIDPLDATHEYTEKLYQYVTTMVCVAINGQPTIGVIHSPFSRSTFWAVVGHGHSDNLKQEVTRNTSKTKVIISRSHSGTIKSVLEFNFKNFEVVIAAGAGYKVIEVANGNVDAYLHITAIKKWDICAGNAILNALGGKMTNKLGETLTYYNDSHVVNKDGLIATMKNHGLFVNKL